MPLITLEENAFLRVVNAIATLSHMENPIVNPTVLAVRWYS